VALEADWLVGCGQVSARPVIHTRKDYGRRARDTRSCWRSQRIRRRPSTLAAGHLTRERLNVGDRIVTGATAGTVRSVEPVLGERELRLVVQICCGTGN
jgi:hypothetical protein